ncbi:MAG: hypothetical protein GX284_15100 [Clostridiales bacterium]|nr:hypothetical protein [Clostridiales bacterium]
MAEVNKEHITKEMFENWQQGMLNSQEEEAFLLHTGKCTYCAEQFGNWMEHDLMEPPAYLKEEIVKRTRQVDVQTVVKVKRTTKRMQLMIYSLKVGLAVVASIFLLTITTNFQNMKSVAPQEQSKQTESVQRKESITDRLNQGSSFVNDALNSMTSGFFQIERETSEEQK